MTVIFSSVLSLNLSFHLRSILYCSARLCCSQLYHQIDNLPFIILILQLYFLCCCIIIVILSRQFVYSYWVVPLAFWPWLLLLIVTFKSGSYCYIEVWILLLVVTFKSGSLCGFYCDSYNLRLVWFIIFWFEYFYDNFSQYLVLTLKIPKK